MRRMIAGPTMLAVLLAFWGAPFFHLHEAGVRVHDHGAAVEYDRETLIHAHLPLIAASHSTPGVSDTEENEKPLDVFTAVTSTGTVLAMPFLAPTRVALTRPAVSTTRVLLPLSPRTHDPPSLR